MHIPLRNIKATLELYSMEYQEILLKCFMYYIAIFSIQDKVKLKSISSKQIQLTEKNLLILFHLHEHGGSG